MSASDLSPLARKGDWNTRMQRQQPLTSQIKQRALTQLLREKQPMQPPLPLDLLRLYGGEQESGSGSD